MGPFGAAGETSEEAWPGEDGKKCETSEKEDCCVENEASVVEGTGLSLDVRIVSRTGGGGIVRLAIRARRHPDQARG